MHASRSSTFLPLFVGDIIVFIGALVLSLAVRYGSWPEEAVINEHLAPFISLFFLWIVVFVIAGLYDTHVSFKRKSLPELLFKVQFLNMLFAVAFFFAFPIGITPKTTLAVYLLISTALLAFWRLYVFPRIVSGTPIRAVIIGSGSEAHSLIDVLNGSPYFKFVTADIIDIDQYPDIESKQSELLRYIDERDINLVVGDMHDERAGSLIELYYNLTFLNHEVRFIALHTMYEQMCHRIPPSLINEGWILEHATRTPHYLYGFVKRAIDVVLGLVLGAVSLIVYPFVIFAIKREDGGPIFYLQERVGQFNAPIRTIKFRTMNGRDTNESALKTSLEVTKVGKVLRKTRIDELPQLWNVVMGDLSFIGPRPEIPSLVSVYAEQIPYYNMRHMIKPGLSGWAQINNLDVPKGGVDVERTIEKLSFDLFYLKRRSLLLDIEIVLKTVKTILMRSGT